MKKERKLTSYYILLCLICSLVNLLPSPTTSTIAKTTLLKGTGILLPKAIKENTSHWTTIEQSVFYASSWFAALIILQTNFGTNSFLDLCILYAVSVISALVVPRLIRSHINDQEFEKRTCKRIALGFLLKSPIIYAYLQNSTRTFDTSNIFSLELEWLIVFVTELVDVQ